MSTKAQASLCELQALPPAQGPGVCRDISVRARRGNLADFDRVLTKAPDAPPLPGDELPEGYERP